MGKEISMQEAIYILKERCTRYEQGEHCAKVERDTFSVNEAVNEEAEKNIWSHPLVGGFCGPHVSIVQNYIRHHSYRSV